MTKEREELKNFFPKGWEEKAQESKAICRTRKISSAVELLHFGEGLPLKETSAVAKEGNISDCSFVNGSFTKNPEKGSCKSKDMIKW